MVSINGVSIPRCSTVQCISASPPSADGHTKSLYETTLAVSSSAHVADRPDPQPASTRTGTGVVGGVVVWQGSRAFFRLPQHAAPVRLDEFLHGAFEVEVMHRVLDEEGGQVLLVMSAHEALAHVIAGFPVACAHTLSAWVVTPTPWVVSPHGRPLPHLKPHGRG